jgi:hypothetical protein
MGKLKDETGNKYGRLTVVSRSENSKQGKTRWDCKCECGTSITVRGSELRTEHTSSCGCLRVKVLVDGNTKHGECIGGSSRLYTCWRGIVKRATNHNWKNARYYVDRGIAVHPEWTGEGGFERFRDYVFEHLGPHPGKGASIDRINNDGNYEPGNIRWATKTIQEQNKRKRAGTASKYRGVCKDKRSGKWKASLSVNGKRKNLGCFFVEEDAANAVNNAIMLYETDHPLNVISMAA